MADGLLLWAVAWIVLFVAPAHLKIKSRYFPMAAAHVYPDADSFGWVQDEGSKYWAKCLETNQADGVVSLSYMNGSRKTVPVQTVSEETWNSGTTDEVPKGWSGVLVVSVATEPFAPDSGQAPTRVIFHTTTSDASVNRTAYLSEVDLMAGLQSRSQAFADLTPAQGKNHGDGPSLQYMWGTMKNLVGASTAVAEQFRDLAHNDSVSRVSVEYEFFDSFAKVPSSAQLPFVVTGGEGTSVPPQYVADQFSEWEGAPTVLTKFKDATGASVFGVHLTLRNVPEANSAVTAYNLVFAGGGGLGVSKLTFVGSAGGGAAAQPKKRKRVDPGNVDVTWLKSWAQGFGKEQAEAWLGSEEALKTGMDSGQTGAFTTMLRVVFPTVTVLGANGTYLVDVVRATPAVKDVLHSPLILSKVKQVKSIPRKIDHFRNNHAGGFLAQAGAALRKPMTKPYEDGRGKKDGQVFIKNPSFIRLSCAFGPVIRDLLMMQPSSTVASKRDYNSYMTELNMPASFGFKEFPTKDKFVNLVDQTRKAQKDSKHGKSAVGMQIGTTEGDVVTLNDTVEATAAPQLHADGPKVDDCFTDGALNASGFSGLHTVAWFKDHYTACLIMAIATGRASIVVAQLGAGECYDYLFPQAKLGHNVAAVVAMRRLCMRLVQSSNPAPRSAYPGAAFFGATGVSVYKLATAVDGDDGNGSLTVGDKSLAEFLTGLAIVMPQYMAAIQDANPPLHAEMQVLFARAVRELRLNPSGNVSQNCGTARDFEYFFGNNKHWPTQRELKESSDSQLDVKYADTLDICNGMQGGVGTAGACGGVPLDPRAPEFTPPILGETPMDVCDPTHESYGVLVSNAAADSIPKEWNQRAIGRMNLLAALSMARANQASESDVQKATKKLLSAYSGGPEAE